MRVIHARKLPLDQGGDKDMVCGLDVCDEFDELDEYSFSDTYVNDRGGDYTDEMTGVTLLRDDVSKARKYDMNWYEKILTFEEVPDERCVLRTRRKPIQPARWVLAALNAVLFTPWSPHLNLHDRSRVQRPTYEESIEAVTLPRFIKIPTAPTQNPKFRKKRRQRRMILVSQQKEVKRKLFPEPLQTSSSAGVASGAAHGTRHWGLPGPKIPKPAKRSRPQR